MDTRTQHSGSAFGSLLLAWCRQHWVITLVFLGFTGLVGLIGAGLSLFGVFVVLPAQTYTAMSSPEWADVNVRLMGFTSPEDFRKAETNLLGRTKSENDPISLYLLGSLYQATNRPQLASEAYRKTISVAKTNWWQETANQYIRDDAYAGLAVLRYENNQPTLALSDLNKISDIGYQEDFALLSTLKNSLENPRRADYHFDLAKELRQQLKFPQAQKELTLALQLSTDPATRVKIENYQKAHMPKTAKALNPYVRYLCLAGNAHGDPDQGGSLKEAVAFYEAASEQDPTFDLVYQQLASVYKEMGDYTRADRYAKIAMNKNTQQYLPYVTLGNIALANEQYPDAIARFNQARGILATLQDDDHATLLANIENQLGFTYELLEDGQNALVHYQQAYHLSQERLDIVNAEGVHPFSEDYTYAQDGIKRAKALIEKTTAMSKMTQGSSLLAKR